MIHKPRRLSRREILIAAAGLGATILVPKPADAWFIAHPAAPMSSRPMVRPAVAFLNRVAAGQTDARQWYYNQCIARLMYHGIWTKLDGLYLFAAAEQATALLSLVSATFNATAINSPTFAANVGFTGNGSSSYIDLNYNSLSGGGLFTQNSLSIFAWSNTAAQQAAGDVGNPAAGAGAHTGFLIRFTDNNLYGNCAGSTYNTGVTDGSGLFHLSRTASNAYAQYRSGVSLATSAGASAALQNATLQIGSENGGFSTRQWIAGGIGGGMTATDATNLYNTLRAYLQKVAGIA